MEGAYELNGVLVRAVGSSGSTARRRLQDPPSFERKIVGQVALATSRKKENEVKEENEKHIQTRMCIARETVFMALRYRDVLAAQKNPFAKSFLTR